MFAKIKLGLVAAFFAILPTLINSVWWLGECLLLAWFVMLALGEFHAVYVAVPAMGFGLVSLAILGLRLIYDIFTDKKLLDE